MSKAELLALLGGQKETLKRRYAVKSLAIFGSAARDALAATSDVDLLVEFDTAPGFDGYMDLKFFLEELIGRPVDLVTRDGLRAELRASVEREAIHVA
jgi:predicted nucleotidyltransferase